MGFLKSIAPALSFIPGWGPVAAAVAGGLGGMLGGSGSGQASGDVGNFYQNALGQLINATGSPAASQFGAMEQRALQPMFDKQDDQMKARLAAMGITNSGAGKNDFSNLAADQSATLSGAIAPLYQQAMGQYGLILGQMPGAQSSAYQSALNNYYQSQGGLGQLLGSLGGGAQNGGLTPPDLTTAGGINLNPNPDTTPLPSTLFGQPPNPYASSG